MGGLNQYHARIDRHWDKDGRLEKAYYEASCYACYQSVRSSNPRWGDWKIRNWIRFHWLWCPGYHFPGKLGG